MLSPVRKAGDQKTHFSDDNHCKSCCACAAPNIKKSVLKFQYILDFPKQLGLQAYSILQAVCKMQRLKKKKPKKLFLFSSWGSLPSLKLKSSSDLPAPPASTSPITVTGMCQCTWIKKYFLDIYGGLSNYLSFRNMTNYWCYCIRKSQVSNTLVCPTS